MFLRLRPFRLLAYVFIDTNLFRHALEERLKQGYIVRCPAAPDETLPSPGRRVPGG